ncbi:MAG: hypothetical protein PHI97_00500 [Desulfobulbus sp.]|nr:hypothetical protein [Desulfobulbus sp.]
MTEAALLKRVARFAERMEATKDNRDTPQKKRAYTLARNCWRRARKQLMCFRDKGNINRWNEYLLDD